MRKDAQTIKILEEAAAERVAIIARAQDQLRGIQAVIDDLKGRPSLIKTLAKETAAPETEETRCGNCGDRLSVCTCPEVGFLVTSTRKRGPYRRCEKCHQTMRKCECKAQVASDGHIVFTPPAQPSPVKTVPVPEAEPPPKTIGLTDRIRAVLPKVGRNGRFRAPDVRNALPNLTPSEINQISALLGQMAERGELIKTGSGRNSTYQLSREGRDAAISVPRDPDAGNY